MILIAGLGNPAQKYADTRHNVGFMLIDEILKTGGFSELGASKFQGELFKKGSLLLLKPQTFMNLSGNSVKAVNDFYKPERIIVVHDDIDLDLGAVKFKKGGLDRELAYGLMQPTGDDDAVIYDKYELSKHEIFKILKQKFEKQS